MLLAYLQLTQYGLLHLLLAHRFEDELAKRHDEAALLCQRNEVVRVNQLTSGTLPTHKRLDADKADDTPEDVKDREENTATAVRVNYQNAAIKKAMAEIVAKKAAAAPGDAVDNKPTTAKTAPPPRRCQSSP